MKRIQELRLERGWSRAELARRARMDASDVGRIEKGLMTPYAAQARKLASALGVRAVNAGRLFEDVETVN